MASFMVMAHCSKSTLLATHSSALVRNNKVQGQPFRGVAFPVGKPLMRLHYKVKKVATMASLSSEKDAAEVIPDKPLGTYSVTVLVTVRRKRNQHLKEMMVSSLESTLSFGQSKERGIVLQLVSNTVVDPDTMVPKVSKEVVIDWQQSGTNMEGDLFTYKLNFSLDADFGVPGAITVSNRYSKEFFLEEISFEGTLSFYCKSWIQPYKVHPNKRIFFLNKAYKPCDTPEGLKRLREEELMELRGDGNGLRKMSDRIYDYDVYNDLGEPDKGILRPTLGGKDNPHPRRCRTGRPPTKTDMNAESPASFDVPMYVPRDEDLGDSKKEALMLRMLKDKLRNLIPLFLSSITPGGRDVFQGYSDIINLYQNDVVERLPAPLKKFKGTLDELFKFQPPKVLPRDSIFLSDDEFARQTIAGINPMNIEKLKDFPPRSTLDPSVYGLQESAFKEDHIIGHLQGISVQQAIDESKLFMLDYHDTYVPFLDRINAQHGKKAHATRTIFFLTKSGTLKPIAIELSGAPNGQKKQVLTTPVDDTTNWLWQLAKAHVASNDVVVHQLVNHWMRIHACMEPFIIAAHRQLSVLHPIYKLLKPHMRYTLKINAQARASLVKAGGFFETEFNSGECGLQMGSAAYATSWRFDLEGLPADLIRRGMAVADPTQPNRLKPLIEDYPYANDGILIWNAIENLVQTYVNHYYSDSNQVQSDKELNAWYVESIKVGHADHANASWWPNLNTPKDLSSILTTLIWLPSAQHAAIHFGQYAYGGYIPSRPPVMRRIVPFEDDRAEYAEFLANPERYFMSSLPNLTQTAKYLATTDVLAGYSPDEEYLGKRRDLSTWSGEVEIVDAFDEFYDEIERIEEEMEKRNRDENMRNRCGDGVLPYELLIPNPRSGLNGGGGGGIPNSVTV